jgi:hypothetical protein
VSSTSGYLSGYEMVFEMLVFFTAQPFDPADSSRELRNFSELLLELFINLNFQERVLKSTSLCVCVCVFRLPREQVSKRRKVCEMHHTDAGLREYRQFCLRVKQGHRLYNSLLHCFSYRNLALVLHNHPILVQDIE